LCTKLAKIAPETGRRPLAGGAGFRIDRIRKLAAQGDVPGIAPKCGEVPQSIIDRGQ